MHEAAIALLEIGIFMVVFFSIAGIYEYVLCPLVERVKEVIEYVLYVQTR